MNVFFCDTPFQLFNMLNLRLNNDDEAELFLVDQFKNAKKIYENLIETKLFTNVYLIKNFNRHNENFITWNFKRIYRYINYKKHFEQCLHINSKGYLNKYDKIYTGVITSFVYSLVKLNPKAEICLVEDGTGSYQGDIISDGVGILHRCFYLITGLGDLAIKPSCIYLNNINAANIKWPTKELPKISSRFLDIAKGIFGVEKDINKKYLNRNLIWLTQPREKTNRENCNIEKNLEVFFEHYKEYLVIRRHPREKTDSAKFVQDKSGTMWELLIQMININEKILIAQYSTAQFNPKLLFRYEPYVIFLTKIYPPSHRVEQMQANIKQLENMYVSKKIFIPENMEELKEIIDKLLVCNKTS